MFPKLLYNQHANYFFNHIKFNLKKKKIYFYLPYVRKTLQMLPFFKYYSLVSSYAILFKNKKPMIRIYLNYYRNMSTTSNFKMMSTISKTFYISCNSLKIIQLRTGCGLYLLSTSKGLMFHTDAIKFKIGGFVIAFFWA